MRPNIGNLYTHKRMLDTAVLILQNMGEENGKVFFKVRWFLRNGVDMNLLDVIKVSKSDFSNWYEWRK